MDQVETVERTFDADAGPSVRHLPPQGFEDPLTLIREAHRRSEMRCGLLERLEEHLLQHGCDSRARATAASLIEHFDSAGAQHELDEEKDVLPALKSAVSRRQKKRVSELIADISRTHAELAVAWRPLRTQLSDIARGVRARLDADVVGRFTTLSLAHIAREDAEVLPEAAEVLNREALRKIGCAMAARRSGPKG